jgi:cystathionine beta-lyase
MKMNAVNENPRDGVIPMTMADMDFPTSPHIVQALQDYPATEILGYSNPTDAYFASVQNFFQTQHNYWPEKDWIVTSPGIVPALSTSVRAFTKENEGVIVMSPVYNPFYEVVETQNRRIVDCALKLKDNRYYIDFDKLENLAQKSDVKMLLLCSPHNPGGRIWTEEELQQIINIALAHNLIIVSDEIHADINLKGKKHFILPAVDPRIENNSVICTAASKTFNIAGLQCSNIFIANPDLRKKFVDTNLAAGMERANVLGMVATKAAYDHCHDWLAEMKTVIEHNQDVVTAFFKKLSPKFKVMEQDASFLAWVDYSEVEADADAFNDFLVRECDFYVNSGGMYGESAKNFIRINVGMPTAQLQENLERFKRGVEEKYLYSRTVSNEIV